MIAFTFDARPGAVGQGVSFTLSVSVEEVKTPSSEVLWRDDPLESPSSVLIGNE